MTSAGNLASYYADVEPSYLLLKEVLRQQSRENILQIIEHKESVPDLDSLFLKDATEFLRLSILNLLAYKSLMRGNFLAWGEVTVYYGAFYSINCLLRLGGFALSHIDFPDEEVLVVRIERVEDEHRYRLLQWKGGNTHLYIWSKFSELYPEMCDRKLAKILIDERVRWNYDLFLPSQSMTDYAKEEAEKRWKNNFLDPDFGNYPDPEVAEYYADLMRSYGYEEAGLGDYIKECISSLTKIAKRSKYKTWYISYFAGLSQGIEDFDSHPDTIKEIQNWLDSSIAELQKT